MTPLLIAGPCAVESEYQVLTTAARLHEVAAQHSLPLDYFRAGVWKSRSLPDTFAGVGATAFPWLAKIQNTYQTPVCVEVMTPQQVELCEKYGIYAVWIGARTGVNPADVQSLADAVAHKPFTVMVKNPLVPDLELWSGNVERFLRADVQKVMTIHRGFAAHAENVYRNAPCWEIPVSLKVRFPELPMLCDPSHLCGCTKWIPQIAQIALNYDFDGLMTECHHKPQTALCDASQQMTPVQWADFIRHLNLSPTADPDRALLRQRALLENIDTQISELLQKRMHIIDEIADIKKTNNLPVLQHKQWQQVEKRYLSPHQDALYQIFIKQFLSLLHQSSIERQK